MQLWNYVPDNVFEEMRELDRVKGSKGKLGSGRSKQPKTSRLSLALRRTVDRRYVEDNDDDDDDL